MGTQVGSSEKSSAFMWRTEYEIPYFGFFCIIILS